MTETIEEANARYFRAAHAMQTGVAHMANPKDGDPKHIRVGINSALVNDLAIAELLIEKGIFTKLEYTIAVADAMEKEVATYEREVSEKLYGAKVTLK